MCEEIFEESRVRVRSLTDDSLYMKESEMIRKTHHDVIAARL